MNDDSRRISMAAARVGGGLRMRRLSGPAVRQAQRFVAPVEQMSEAEQERRLELAQDGREDAEREAVEVEAEQSYESEA